MFSHFLRKAIEESGKTQKVVADEAGITQAALANYLNGSRSPQFEVVELLCKSCGYSVKFEKVSTNVGIPANDENKESPLTSDEIKELRELLKGRGAKRKVG